VTRAPTRRRVTPAPSSMTSPAASRPRIAGSSSVIPESAHDRIGITSHERRSVRGTPISSKLLAKPRGDPALGNSRDMPETWPQYSYATWSRLSVNRGVLRLGRRRKPVTSHQDKQSAVLGLALSRSDPVMSPNTALALGVARECDDEARNEQ
jgi:hypothetical protein